MVYHELRKNDFGGRPSFIKHGDSILRLNAKQSYVEKRLKREEGKLGNILAGNEKSLGKSGQKDRKWGRHFLLKKEEGNRERLHGEVPRAKENKRRKGQGE